MVIGTSKMLILPITEKNKVEWMDFSSDIDKAMVRATFRPSLVILATKLFF